jgi:hypothetical protein
VGDECRVQRARVGARHGSCIRFGLNVTLLTGAVAYLLAVLLSPGLLKLRKT